MKVVKTLLVAGSLMLVASTAMAETDGAAVYNGGCAACHATGVAGAPKVGDQAAWAERVAQDKETTYGHAINGFQGKSGVMPPKGGFTNLSDDEIKAAVDYMLESSK
jgi:cytochrome c5